MFERIGFDEVGKRELFLLAVRDPIEAGAALLEKDGYFAGHFVALLVCDARLYPVTSLSRLARRLLDAGCVYFCCWGPECDRVHDIIDREYASGISSDGREATVMTTWHEDESLEEAAWFSLTSAYPDDEFTESCGTVLAVSIGSENWANKLSAAFEDPRALAASVVSGSGSAA